MNGQQHVRACLLWCPSWKLETQATADHMRLIQRSKVEQGERLSGTLSGLRSFNILKSFMLLSLIWCFVAISELCHHLLHTSGHMCACLMHMHVCA